MDLYETKLKLVEDTLVIKCKDIILHNWDRMFDMWLIHDADLCFGNIYISEFNKEFERYMKDHIKSNLFFAGTNLVYALKAFMKYKEDCELDDILAFTELFITEQIGEFSNWCEDISGAMYEETSEYEREHADDSNPS